MRTIGCFNKIYISIILIFSLHPSAGASTEFTWVNKSRGLAGYEFTSLCIDKNDPDLMYAGAKGALLKTTDGGKNWKNIFKVPGSNNAVNYIAVNPRDRKTIYLATELGIFKSADEGSRWSNVSRNIRGHNVFQILLDSDDPNILFAVTENSVYKSMDAAGTWRKSSDGISAKDLGSIAQNPMDGKKLFVSSNEALFKSEDYGKTWQKIFFPNIAGEENPFQEEYSEEGGLFRKAFNYIAVDGVNPSIIYLATKKGVFKSTDSGASWKRLSKSGLPRCTIRNFVVSLSTGGYLFLATDRGVIQFSADDNLWKEVSAGLSERKINFIASNAEGNTLWIAAKGGVFGSDGNIYQIDKSKSDSGVEAILQNFRNEPSFRQVQEAAIVYAEVHPNKIAKWRRDAKMKALLPTLSVGMDRDSSQDVHWDAGSNPDMLIVGPYYDDTGWDIRCSWDLGGLIWNDDQTSIDTRSKLMVELRNDIIDEVTRLYFERRRLQVELMQSPPKDERKLMEKELRIQELTANIDGITGGYFSRETR
ncbi:MAG: YCF48-related protein [Candidatus Omnitrophota bacterium]